MNFRIKSIENEAVAAAALEIFGSDEESIEAAVTEDTITIGEYSTAYTHTVADIINPKTKKALVHFKHHTYQCGAIAVETTKELNGYHLVNYLGRKLLAAKLGTSRGRGVTKREATPEELAEIKAEREILKALRAKD